MSKIPAGLQQTTLYIVVLTAALAGFPRHCEASVAVPAASRSAISPSFTLTDLSGGERSLRSYAGHSVVLFFFCGCDRCHAAARAWSQVQRVASGGGMDSVESATTIVVFSGEADEARQFEKDTMLDPARTVVLLDPDDNVSEGLYNADPCPRVFVLNAAQRAVYTNDHSDDRPRGDDQSAMIARVVNAVAANGPKSVGKA